MTAPRRIVTGHDADGNPVIKTDEPATNGISRRPGHRSWLVWSTDTVPADNAATDDPTAITSRHLADGTVFRIAEYGPGVEFAPHQTDSVDYAVVISGEIDLVVGQQTTRVRAGDVIVQRGTAHDWRNDGTESCMIAFCLVGAKPLPV